MRLPILLLALLTACSAQGGAAPATPGHPVAVELFTSQGCSSCPPADALLAKLASDPNVVAITRPVTYWDQLGWKDTLAKPANTALQQAYAREKIPGGGVFTPQAVAQGRFGVIGGNEGDLRRRIADAGKLAEPGIAVTAQGDGSRMVTLTGAVPRQAQVSVMALRRDVAVAIGRGENGGRMVQYANVLVDERVVGGAGGPISIAPAMLRMPGADRYALVVRVGSDGPILAARYL
jgi:hypothetical protein